MKALPAFVTLLLVCCSASLAAARSARPVPELEAIGVVQSGGLQFPDPLARMYPNGGEARLLITVRADGELTEWLVTGYSAPAFRSEAVTVLKDLKFIPARMKGETITARAEIVVRFEARGMLVSTSTSMEAFNLSARSGFEHDEFYRAFPVNRLDRLPKALQVVSPIYPQELADKGVVGSVTVDFYIDEEGAVRMPSVLEQEPFALANAAVNAIRQWRFESPMRQGKPALAHAQQVFNFGVGARAAR
ncbi:MAG: TonB family protein [Opitutaceae bacterium]